MSQRPDEPRLDYAPPLPWRRRKGARRLLSVVLALGLIAAGWYWRAPVLLRFETLYWQRQAMNYFAPTDRVVYDNDPRTSPVLARSDPRYVWQLPQADGPAAGPGRVIYFARPWEMFYACLSPPGRPLSATLFLHARRAPGRPERLVEVEWGGQEVGADFVAFAVVAPGSLASPPQVVCVGGVHPWLANAPANPSRFFAGQPDPADPAHFTIDFQYSPAGKRGTLDGWLNADDSVTLEVRKQREGDGETRRAKPESPDQ